jgi:hypothetical protein
MLDAKLWTALERHGVTEAHLTMLLQLLELQKNGSWNWRFVQGKLDHTELRLVCASRPAEIGRVSEALVE